MKSMDMPPYAPSLIESTRAIGYSVETAIADVVDNSIAAKASCVDIFFFPLDDPYIAILDDGTGMSDEQINVAMQYGSKSPNAERDQSDLGRFGLGLKTASLSQCRILTVISKQHDNVVGRRWDIDHVLQTGKWSLLVVEKEHWKDIPRIQELLQKEKGTLVVWQGLDRLMAGEINPEQAFGRKIDLVRQHLSLVFHRYLSGEVDVKRLLIRINNTQIAAADPFLIKKSTQAMADETLMINGHRVVLRAYVLPHMSRLTSQELTALGGKEGLRRRQGFYVYRNKRLIVWATWFGMMRQGELSKLARIQVDVPNALDNLWTLDIKKSTAIPPAVIRDNLRAIIERIAEGSKRTWTFRGRKETDDSIVRIWQRFSAVEGGVFYEINRDHPIVDGIMEEYPAARLALDALLRQIEANLPLNQLYVDLNGDKQIQNDVTIPQAEVEKVLGRLLSTAQSSQHRLAMLERLENVEPFVNYPELVMMFKERELTR